MKGVILAGGTGTRLYPVTISTNKHLLPVYNKPMVYYPLSLMMLMEIRELVIVINPEDKSQFEGLLGDGSHLGMNITYAIQPAPNGLAGGLLSAKESVEGENICLILGDNILYGHDVLDILNEAKRYLEDHNGAYVFGYHVPDPERFGVVEFDERGNVLSIKEKPERPRSNFAVIGLYMYDRDVFEKISRIRPSERGELEITSLNEEYLKEGKLKVKLLGRGFAWFDVGTHDSFLEGSEFVGTVEKRTGLMIGCVEEIAYRNGWIDRKQLLRLAERLNKTDYGRYLQAIAEEEKDAI